MSDTTQFFPDPAMDALTKAVVTLAMELWVANERIENLESIIVRGGLATEADVQGDKASSEMLEKLEKQRTEYIARVLAGVRHAVRGGSLD